jgi:hypothetical protein
MSQQAETWVAHTKRYLAAVDPHLADVFLQAMREAGYPAVSAADALEGILADFLAGARRPVVAASEPHGTGEEA